MSTPTLGAALPLNEAWRSPSIRLLANGTPIAGVVDVDVIANNHFAADRFHARIALGADQMSPASFWASATGILIDIRLSLDGATFQSVIQGLADSVTLDPVVGLVRLEGRSLTAALIETRSMEAFANRTSSEIATLVAQRHGLTPEVTATSTPVGRYYQDEHDRVTLGLFSRAISEWDQLVFLARHEGFDVFVQGTSLFFTPPQPPTGPYVLQPTDLLDLRLERSLTLARDIEVTVKSWNSRQKSAFSQTARATGGRLSASSRSGALPPQRYVVVRPNLTPDEALQLAQRRLAELTRHERIVAATMPGELSLTPRSQISLLGTGTDFDQTYFIDVIERSLGSHGGFTQRIRAKNTSPRTETLISGDDAGTGGGV
jgi:phage protein D